MQVREYEASIGITKIRDRNPRKSEIKEREREGEREREEGFRCCSERVVCKYYVLLLGTGIYETATEWSILVRDGVSKGGRV